MDNPLFYRRLLIVLLGLGMFVSEPLWGQGAPDEDIWERRPQSSYVTPETEVSKASVHAFSDLVNEQALDFQNEPTRPQIVSGGGTLSDSDRLRKPLIIIFSGLAFLVLVILIVLNYILVRVSNRVYQTRLETVRDQRPEGSEEENDWQKAYRKDRERLQKYKDVDWDD